MHSIGIIPSKLGFNNETMILSLSGNDPHRKSLSLQDKLQQLLNNERLSRKTNKPKRRRTYRRGRGSRKKRRRRRRRRTCKRRSRKKNCKGCCYLF